MSKNVPPAKRAARVPAPAPVAQRTRTRAIVRAPEPEIGAVAHVQDLTRGAAHVPEVAELERAAPSALSDGPVLEEDCGPRDLGTHKALIPSESETSEAEDPPLSSTPIRAVARPAPSELRIKTQIRHALAAGSVEVQAQRVTEPAYADIDDCDSDASINSCDSTRTVDGRRIVLSEMPRQAGAVLQKAKTDLESSGNLKREIRENVVSALQLMYEMVLKLSDSRNLHMVESYRLKEGVTRGRERQAQKHARALESALAEYRRLEAHVEKLASEVEALRRILVFDACEPIRELQQSTQLALRESPGLVSSVLAKVADMSAGLEPLRAALHTMLPREAQRASDPDTASGLEVAGLRAELELIRQEMASLNRRRMDYPLSEVTTEDIIAAVREASLVTPAPPPANTLEMQQILQTCTQTQAAVVEVRDGLLALRDGLPSGETAELLGSKVEELRRSVGELRDTTVDTAAPIRRTVEHLQGLMEARMSPEFTQERAPEEISTVRAGPARSYAEALGAPGHNLMVESIDPRHTSDDIIKTIKAKVDVVALGVGVNSVRRLRNQKVAIGCASQRDREALGDAIKVAGEGFTVVSPPPKLPLIRLVGVISDLRDGEIVLTLPKQNAGLLDGLSSDQRQLRVVRRTRGRTPATTNVILEVGVGLWQRLNGQRVKLGYQVVLAVDQSPIVQCYNCLGFGHFARDCKLQLNCGYCAEAHDTRECPSRTLPPRCVNCHKGKRHSNPSHPAYSGECPEWSKWDRISRSVIRYC